MNAKVFENIRKNNIKQDASFNSGRESIKKTLNTPMSALMHSRNFVDNFAEYECEVNQIKNHLYLNYQVM